MSSLTPAYTDEDVTARAEHLIRITYPDHQKGGSLPQRIWIALAVIGTLAGLLVTLFGMMSNPTPGFQESWEWAFLLLGAGIGCFAGAMLGLIVDDVVYSRLRAQIIALKETSPEAVHQAFANVREADARRAMARRRR